MPNRSALSTTMTVASGTSTPTSITVVATSTSISPRRNCAIASSRAAGAICPCSSPTRSPASSPAARRSNSSVAERASTRGESPTSGQTTKARWPAATSWRTRSQARCSSAGSGNHVVVTATRPGGSSSSTVRSRSPKITMAAVRGMGVAVMTRRSGSPVVPLGPQRGPLLDPEAVLLVDDHHAERPELDLLGEQGMGARPRSTTVPLGQVRQHLRPGPCP